MKEKELNGFLCSACILPVGRIILVDVSVPHSFTSKILGLETIDGRPLALLDYKVAASLLENFLREIVAEEDKVLFVFPGDGSDYPRRYSEICHGVPSAKVFAKRLWTPGSEPFVITSQILHSRFIDLSTRLVVVVDDVISSGQTLHKIYARNSWHFPAAKWIGATWVSRRLSMKSPSGISGYEKVFASFSVPDFEGRKIPINSLSTLADNPKIAGSYAKRNFKDVHGFLDLMQDVFDMSFDHHIE